MHGVHVYVIFFLSTNAKIEWNLICLKRIYMQTFDSRRMRKQKHTHTPKSVENIRVTQRTFCSHSIDECVSKRNKKYNVFFSHAFVMFANCCWKKLFFFHLTFWQVDRNLLYYNFIHQYCVLRSHCALANIHRSHRAYYLIMIHGFFILFFAWPS